MTIEIRPEIYIHETDRRGVERIPVYVLLVDGEHFEDYLTRIEAEQAKQWLASNAHRYN
jgi:hypothetical protein